MSRDPLSILICVASYFPRLGGLQTVVRSLTRTLLEYGHAPSVVTNRYPLRLPPRSVIDGVVVRRWLFLQPSMRYWGTGRADLALAALPVYPYVRWRLAQWIEALRPQVVNLHFLDSQIPYILELRRRFKFRLVLSVHGHDIERYYEMGGSLSDEVQYSNKSVYWKNFLDLKLILQEAGCVTACSKYLLQRAIAIQPSIAGKSRVIYNGTDFEGLVIKGSRQHSGPYMLSFGRFVYKKGFDLLLGAFARVAHKHMDVDLILAGEGEEEARLKALCQSLGLARRVVFYGPAQSSELAALLSGCEFMVMPSRQEPFGLAALEAMARGKYVLATRVGGVAEFLGGGNELVEPTIDGLQGGLERLLCRRDALKDIGRANRVLAKKYSSHNMTDQYVEVYRAVLEGAKRS